MDISIVGLPKVEDNFTSSQPEIPTPTFGGLGDQELGDQEHELRFTNDSIISNMITSPANPENVYNEQSLFITFSVIYGLIFILFTPLHAKIVKDFWSLTSKKQPMFYFYAAIHLICVIDSMFCVAETVILWMESPPELFCQYYGTHSAGLFFFLSLDIGAICIYRYLY